MHKIRYMTFLLLLMFCVIPVISILMIHHLTLTDTLSKMGTGAFGKSSTVLKVDNFSNVGDIIDSLSDERTDVAIYLDSSDEQGTVRYIFFNKKYVNLPMKSGRFFKATDFQNNNLICVIGKDRTDETYERESDTFISVNGLEYKVIGVLGYENSTVLDSYIFINMCISDATDMGIFVYDFMDIDEPESNIDKIVEFFNDKNIKSEVYSKTANFSESVMPKVLTARWFICVLIACFFCLWLVSIRWIEQQKREMCIRRLVGASQKDISLLIIFKYLGVFVISFIVGFVYCNVIYPAYFSSLCIGYLVSAVFICIFLVWSVYKLLHTPIEEVIK